MIPVRPNSARGGRFEEGRLNPGIRWVNRGRIRFANRIDHAAAERYIQDLRSVADARDKAIAYLLEGYIHYSVDGLERAVASYRSAAVTMTSKRAPNSNGPDPMNARAG